MRLLHRLQEFLSKVFSFFHLVVAVSSILLLPVYRVNEVVGLFMANCACRLGNVRLFRMVYGKITLSLIAVKKQGVA
jgi:hypothetical protein